MEYPHSYPVGVPGWVLQGSIGATSKKLHCYFSVGTSAVTVYHIAGHSKLAVYVSVEIFTKLNPTLRMNMTS